MSDTPAWLAVRVALLVAVAVSACAPAAGTPVAAAGGQESAAASTPAGVAWTATFSGNGSVTVTDATRTGNGTLVVGYRGEDNAAVATAWLVADDGTVRWRQTLAGSASEARAVTRPADGTVVVAGFTRPNESRVRGWATELTVNGSTGWTTQFQDHVLTPNGTRLQPRVPLDVARTDGGVAVAGLDRSAAYPLDSTSSTDRGWLAVLTPTGEMRWNRTYGSNERPERLSAVVPTAEGFLLGGETRVNPEGPTFDIPRMWLLAAGEDGALVANRTVGRNRSQTLAGAAPVGDGAVFAGTRNNMTRRHAVAIRMNASGGVVWSRVLALDWDFGVRAAAPAGEGRVALAGERFGAGDRDGFVAVLDESGELAAGATAGGQGADFVSALARAGDRLVVAGSRLATGEAASGTVGWLASVEPTADFDVNVSVRTDAAATTGGSPDATDAPGTGETTTTGQPGAGLVAALAALVALLVSLTVRGSDRD